MPIKKSAKKYMSVTEKKTALNKKRKLDLRAAVKEVIEFTKEGKKDDAKKSLVKAQKALDKAVKGGVIKKNNASRKKSRLSKAIKAIA
ncbi:MAG: 30S ribosomal protein S20 [Patescibacteria group bacterium]|jgi:small subunit ribosomal protein S20|nr:30S ribosomal protein S20 [Patescibacteria group bacterium]